MRDDHGMTPAALAAWQLKWGKGPHVTADVVVFTLTPELRLAVLLIQRGIPPFQGEFAIPGGFVQLDEDLETAARRELAEETGVTERVAIDQLATFGAPGRDPRGRTVTVAYTALVPFEKVSHARGGDDAAAARFFVIEGDRAIDERGKKLRLAFDQAVEEALHENGNGRGHGHVPNRAKPRTENKLHASVATVSCKGDETLVEVSQRLARTMGRALRAPTSFRS